MHIKKDKVIFVYPSYDPDNPFPDFNTDKMKKQPVGVFVLASYIKSLGYDVLLLDGRKYGKKEFKEILLNEAKDAFCVGFSVMTCQIKHAYQLSDELKKIYPDLCLVWGGIHPTLFPEQCIQPQFVNYVIYGEAEYSLQRFLEILKNPNADFTSVANLVWKDKNGNMVMNSLGPYIDINELPDPDYSLLDIDLYMEGPFWNYFEYEVERLFDINTSRGCPYNCSFCATTLPAFKKWRPLSADRVNKLIDKAVGEYKAKHIWFIDDFFFGDKERVQNILHYIKDKKYNFTWEALTTIPLFKNYFTDDLLRLMRETGCIVIGMGIESGSDRILKKIRKPQNVESIMHAIRRCKQFDIIPKPSFITGIPGETEEEAIETLKLIARIAEEWPRTSFYVPSVFRPYPGTELYKDCIDMGFKEPKTLEEWLQYELHDNYFIRPKDLPWIKNPAFHINVPYVTYNYLYYKFYNDKSKLPMSRKLAGKLAEKRIEGDWWWFPYEYKLTHLKKGLEKKPWLKKLVKMIT